MFSKYTVQNNILVENVADLISIIKILKRFFVNLIIKHNKQFLNRYHYECVIFSRNNFRH